jgi:hypothetical protein
MRNTLDLTCEKNILLVAVTGTGIIPCPESRLETDQDVMSKSSRRCTRAQRLHDSLNTVKVCMRNVL